ncbi:unnamed protein product [Larinioides sclopetarius]|uniref:IGFBP N-terminal domain-containing protein n=1 Tax=Larinioides sclopetarius TaxID=280406 RepID=A0AAV2B8Q3_9ARAC
MRNIILCFTFLAFIGVLIVHVESSSPRKCPPPHRCYPCDLADCKCGKLKDECNCCDVCMRCKDEPCSVLAGDVCEEGYSCGDPERPYLQQIHNPATCIPLKSRQPEPQPILL